MADREVSVDVTANDRTGPALNSTARGFDRLSRKVRESTERWAKDGDNAGKRFAARAILGLGRIAASGSKIGVKFSDHMGAGLKSGGPYLTAALVAVMAAAAPIAGAALVSGILLALGGGFLVAGIVSALDSPKVQSAWKRFGDRAKGAFENAFNDTDFNRPLIRAADTFGDAVERIGAKVKESGLSKTFADIVDRLAPALASMAENALPGMLRAIEASAPYFDLLADHAPKIGEAISKFFDKIADAGPGAELFFERFLQAIEVLLPAIGSVIAWLSDMFVTVDSGIRQAIVYFVRFGRRVLDIFGALVDGAATALSWVPGLGPKLDAAADKFRRFRDKANAYLQGIEDQVVNVTVRYGTMGTPPRGVPDYHGGGGPPSGFSRAETFAMAARADTEVRRTGGPAPVTVDSTVNVMLDGTPFRHAIARAVSDGGRRDRWRARQGRRYAPRPAGGW